MSHLTQKAIKASFVKLLNQRPFDKITVKDIVEDCGINRNTFYYYYQDIYALLEEILEDEAVSALRAEVTYTSLQEGIVQSARFALENKRAVYHIYNSINREQLERYLLRVVGNLIQEYVSKRRSGRSVGETDVRLITDFYKHAIVGIMMEWLERGMQDDPEAAIYRLGQLLEGEPERALKRAEEIGSGG